MIINSNFIDYYLSQNLNIQFLKLLLQLLYLYYFILNSIHNFPLTCLDFIFLIFIIDFTILIKFIIFIIMHLSFQKVIQNNHRLHFNIHMPKQMQII